MYILYRNVYMECIYGYNYLNMPQKAPGGVFKTY